MRLGLVSTYPPTRCGIATYTRLLAGELAKRPDLQVTVLAEKGGAADLPNLAVEPVFSRREPFARPILEAVDRLGLEAVHLQHAPDILGMGRELFALLEGLKERQVRSLVTLHTVYTTWSGLLERKPHAAWFHHGLGQRADVLVVHQPSMARTLAAHGVPQARIHEIPHATEQLAGGDGQKIRQRLGIPVDAPVLLFFGFVHVQKNVHSKRSALAPSVSWPES
jgi:glycosyltransferase involved in cell wall biosynthesis